jgi:hypothetical protein
MNKKNPAPAGRHIGSPAGAACDSPQPGDILVAPQGPHVIRPSRATYW